MLAAHLAFVTEGYARYAAGDLAAALEAFSEDVVWYSSGPPNLLPTGGERRGKPALIEFFDLLRRDWTIEEFEPLEFFGHDDRVAARVRVRIRRNAGGRAVDVEKADLLTIRNSKIVEFREYFDSASMLELAGYKFAKPA